MDGTPGEDDQSLLLDTLREFPEFVNVTEQTRPLDKDELAGERSFVKVLPHPTNAICPLALFQISVSKQLP